MSGAKEGDNDATHIAEKDVCQTDGKLGTRVKYKFAFQYCNGQGVPWWAGNSSGVSDYAPTGKDGTPGGDDVSEQATEKISKNKRLSDVPVPNTQFASPSESGCAEPKQKSDDATPASNVRHHLLTHVYLLH